VKIELKQKKLHENFLRIDKILEEETFREGRTTIESRNTVFCSRLAIAEFCRVYAVVNEAPFHVVESGYGGFLLPVDIYLRTSCEPRRLRFLYDLQLDSSCSVACVRYEKVVFWNPSEPLRSALRQSGAVSRLPTLSKLSIIRNCL